MLKTIRSKWNGLNVSMKLGLALGCMVVLLGFMAFSGLGMLHTIRERTNHIVGEGLLAQRLALQIGNNIQHARQAEKDYFLHLSTDGAEESARRYGSRALDRMAEAAAATSRLNELIARKASGKWTAKAITDNNRISELITNYTTHFREAVDLVEKLHLGEDALQLRQLSTLRALNRIAATSAPAEIRNDIRRLEDSFEQYHAAHKTSAMSKTLSIGRSIEKKLANMPGQQPLRDSLNSFIGVLEQVELTVTSLTKTVHTMDMTAAAMESLVNGLAGLTTQDATGVQERILSHLTLMRSQFWLSFGLALILAFGLWRLLSNALVVNIRRLTLAADRFRKGAYNTRATCSTNDEIGRLTESFNSMAGRIEELVRELEGQATLASDRLLEAIESMSEGFALYDKDDRLVLCNSKYREIDRNTSENIQYGVTFEDAFTPNLLDGVYAGVVDVEEWRRERIRRHRDPSGPFEQELADGRTLLINEVRTPAGETVSLVADITEQRKARDELAVLNAGLEDTIRDRTQNLVRKARELRLANRRLLELDELKSNFLSSVSHELRTPLTSLLGFTKLIRKDFIRTFKPVQETDTKTAKVSKRILSNLDIISTEGDRLTRLINDVLDLGRIESGRMSWRDELLEIKPLIRRALDSVSGQFLTKSGVTLAEPICEDDLPQIKADPDRILQVLINLLNNAAKFTERGEVSVEATQDGRGYLRLRIRDTGVGIQRDQLDKIFEQFHQACQGDTLRCAPGGSGLGLTISRQIVEHYGGRIVAESRPGRGTVMTVVLPPADHDPEAKEAEAKGRTILVVDDDPVMREYITGLLNDEGYQVFSAGDGHEALETAEDIRPDLVTMDLLMPGMDGGTAIKHLRTLPELSRTPILVVSVKQGVAGADAAMSKPLRPKVFIEAVRCLVSKRPPEIPLIAVDLEENSMPCNAETRHVSLDALPHILGDDFSGLLVMREETARRFDIATLEDHQAGVLVIP